MISVLIAIVTVLCWAYQLCAGIVIAGGEGIEITERAKDPVKYWFWMVVHTCVVLFSVFISWITNSA